MLKQFFCLCTLATLATFSSYATDNQEDPASSLACDCHGDKKDVDPQPEIACDCHTQDQNDDEQPKVAFGEASDEDNQSEIACNKHKGKHKDKKHFHHDNEDEHSVDQPTLASCQDDMCTTDEADEEKFA
jgi:hypothetical protein